MKFRLDQKGIASLKREPQMHVFINALTMVVADNVQGPHRTGRYMASVDPAVMGYASAKGRVYARDFKAWWIEFGAGASPVRGNHTFRARHPMRNGVLATGLRYVPRTGKE